MLTYCLKKKDKVVKTKDGRIIALLNCAVFGSKKVRFIKEQEAGTILDSLCRVVSVPLRLLGM